MRESNNWGLRALGYAQVAAGGLNSAIALPSIPAGAQVAIIKPATQAIRFRDDGTDPTASVGYPVAVGAEYIYSASSLGAVKLIASTAGAALDILYYG